MSAERDVLALSRLTNLIRQSCHERSHRFAIRTKWAFVTAAGAPIPSRVYRANGLPICCAVGNRAVNRWRQPLMRTSAMSALGQKRTSAPEPHVRFTPDSGHQTVRLRCPLSANSRHGYSITSSAIGAGESCRQCDGRFHGRLAGKFTYLQNVQRGRSIRGLWS